jgi:hypothetical protein
VTKQSEHLSSAQIENYGIRTSGAGPETAQRDEHQRAEQRMADKLSDDQSAADQSMIDQRSNDQRTSDQDTSDQRIEAHLADCASCRNRLLEFHRSLFASPTYQPEPDRMMAADRTMAEDPKNDHTNSALADSKFANLKDPADPQVRTAATPECPSDDALRQLAAGLSSDDAAAKLTQHAATCHHCGPLLRTYTEFFSDDFSPEEQAALANLQSSSAEWQKNTARQMMQTASTSTADASAADQTASEAVGSRVAATVKPDEKPAGRLVSTVPDRKPTFWKWALVPASAAVIAVAAFSIWYTQRDTPEKAEQQLAQAYTEQRPTEMRWPKASWSQYSVQRGTKFEAKPTSLMQAEIAVGRQTEKTLQEVAWIRVVAEKEIIAGHPQNAIPALEQAVRSNPSSDPLLLDLAIAYFDQGEQTRSQESYEKSRDLLVSVLQREPTNTVALFNRALVYERLNVKDKAADDWKTFLKTEKDVHWLAEAQKKLSDLSDLN